MSDTTSEQARNALLSMSYPQNMGKPKFVANTYHGDMYLVRFDATIYVVAMKKGKDLSEKKNIRKWMANHPQAVMASIQLTDQPWDVIKQTADVMCELEHAIHWKEMHDSFEFGETLGFPKFDPEDYTKMTTVDYDNVRRFTEMHDRTRKLCWWSKGNRD